MTVSKTVNSIVLTHYSFKSYEPLSIYQFDIPHTTFMVKIEYLTKTVMLRYHGELINMTALASEVVHASLILNE